VCAGYNVYINNVSEIQVHTAASIKMYSGMLRRATS
jgi:hypothetical protein